MEVKVSQAEAVRNFYRKQGAEQELLRIVKLLETSKSKYPVGGSHEYFLEFAIALIKGENK